MYINRIMWCAGHERKQDVQEGHIGDVLTCPKCEGNMPDAPKACIKCLKRPRPCEASRCAFNTLNCIWGWNTLLSINMYNLNFYEFSPYLPTQIDLDLPGHPGWSTLPGYPGWAGMERQIQPSSAHRSERPPWTSRSANPSRTSWLGWGANLYLPKASRPSRISGSANRSRKSWSGWGGGWRRRERLDHWSIVASRL